MYFVHLELSTNGWAKLMTSTSCFIVIQKNDKTWLNRYFSAARLDLVEGTLYTFHIRGVFRCPVIEYHPFLICSLTWSSLFGINLRSLLAFIRCREAISPCRLLTPRSTNSCWRWDFRRIAGRKHHFLWVVLLCIPTIKSLTSALS